jgi:hypothetical protein
MSAFRRCNLALYGFASVLLALTWDCRRWMTEEMLGPRIEHPTTETRFCVARTLLCVKDQRGHIAERTRKIELGNEPRIYRSVLA